jgi:hypothetical protein
LPRFSHRTAHVFLTVLLLLAAGGGPSAAVDVSLQLLPEHQRHADRVRDAATEAIARYSEWFGPPPFERLIVESVRTGAPAADQRGHVVVPLRWLQPTRSLLMEADVARAIARQWWGVGITMPDRFLADGIAEYAQARALERIYDRRLQRLAYSTYERRFFGDLVPWAIRALRLERVTTGIGRDDYRRHPDVDVRAADPALQRAQAAKVAAALMTLERYIGWPALQRGLSLAAERYRGTRMTAEDFARTMGDASDRDLSWFFDPVFNGETNWDYAVESVATETLANTSCGAGPCVRSTVIVRRNGNTAFTGTSHQPSGGFEAGRAIEIELEFADGQRMNERWDGRAETRTLVYDAPSPLIRATVDPRDVLALDLRRLNNSQSTTPGSPGALAAWTARWTIWFQDLLLTQSILF